MGSDAIFSKVFNLKKGEGKTVFLLTAYSFFAGLAYAYFYATSTTLFLAKFDIKVLPYAYIGQGVVSYCVWLSYKRIEKKIIPSRLFMISGLFLMVSVAILAGGFIVTGSKVFAFILFVWYNIFLLLNGISFWGIATKVFDLRQAKRLFGLISSGEVFARIISFFSVSFLAKVMKTDHIFYMSIAGLAMCIILAPIITSTLKEKIDIKRTAPEPAKEQPTSSKGLGKLIENKYFGYIFLLALFPLFATFYIDFMFLGQVKIQYTNAKVISGFLSLFLGSMSVAEFLLRTFVSGRLISKYGVLFGILMLPITLTLSTVLAAVYGSFYGAVGLFFSFIILSRLFIRVIRTIFFDSTFQIFYQPIPIHDRLALQSKVEGVSKSIGFILAGAILVVLAHAPFLNVVHYNYIFLAVLAVWIWISFKLYNEYRGSLKAVLSNLIGHKSSSKTSAFASLSGFITLSDNKKTQITLNLTERTYPQVADLLMLRLLPKVEQNTQNAILQRINYKKITPAVNILDFCMTHNSGSAAPFKETKKELEENTNINFKTLSALAESTDAEERLKAVYLMDNHENYNNYKLLVHLLQDEDIRVRNAALIICGKMKKHELWPHIIESLYDPRSAYAAAIAVRQVGEPILNDLVEFFNKDNLPKEAQIKIIDLFAEVNGKHIPRLLKSKITLADEDVRRHIFTTLGEMQFQFAQSEYPTIKNYIEEDIYCIAWIVAAILDMGVDHHHDPSMLHHSLQLEFTRKKAFVFLELSMIYDQKTINFFIHGFEDASQEARAYALEVLDMTVSPEFKPLFLPLLTDLEHHELLKAYATRFAQEQMPVRERLEDIINKNYSKISPWTKACAINLIAHFDNVENILLANVLNDSKLLSEMALWELYNKYPQKLAEFGERIADRDKPKIINRLKYFAGIHKEQLLIFDAVTRLKHNPFFMELTEFELVPVAEGAKQVFVAAGTQLSIAKSELEDLYFVLEGACDVQFASGSERLIAREFYWYVQSGPSITELTFNAHTDTILLQIDSNTMFTLLAEHMHLSKRIINVLSKQEA